MRVVFAGTPEFAAVSLRELLRRGTNVTGVLTQPDRRAGRGRRLNASPVKQLAIEHGLTVQQPLTLRDNDARADLAALSPELLVVAAYGLLLPQAVLDLPSKGCVNVHASLLPRWRGAAPIQRAIEHGDSITGVCLMQMEAGLDTGPVLDCRRCEIGPSDTAAVLHDRLAALGASLLGDSLSALASASLSASAQATTGICYAERLRKDEAWIDWRDAADVIERRVRAFNPWPVACTLLAGDRIRIWRSSYVAVAQAEAPGTILPAERDTLLVACGDAALSIDELQFPGGRRLSARDVVNSGRITPGALLGLPADARA